MRKRPLKLEQLGILNVRSELCHMEQNEFNHLNTGYEGELEFDKVLTDFIQNTNNIHIKDYRFKVKPDDGGHHRRIDHKGSEVQIDSLLISKNRIYTFEVKKYTHDLIYSDDDWSYVNGDIFRTPMPQISRQNHELKFLLKKIPHHIEVYSCIVFINPHQTVYNLPYGKNILVRSNLSNFLQRNMSSNSVNYQNLCDYLESKRIYTSMYDAKVNIGFNELKTGVYCPTCYRALFKENQYRYTCKKCMTTLNTLTVAKRLAEEISILNHEWPITPKIISQFSGGAISCSYIRKMNKIHF